MKDNPLPAKKQVSPFPDQNAAERSSVIYLYSNNSTEGCGKNRTEVSPAPLLPSISGYAKKQAETLNRNVLRLIELAPSPGHVGMLTLTFKDNVKDHREAYRRFRSFNSHYLAPSLDYSHWLLVKERQKRGAWHYHMIVICAQDIRSDFSEEKYKWWLEQRNKGKKRRLSTGNKYLHELWERNRAATAKYGFGIPHLLPMMGPPEAMARYVGKYISKHMGNRKPEDKGVRLVQTSKGWPKNSVKYSWHNENSVQWRRGVRCLANRTFCESMSDIKEKFGPKWAYWLRDEVYNYQEYIDEVEAEVPF